MNNSLSPETQGDGKPAEGSDRNPTAGAALRAGAVVGSRFRELQVVARPRVLIVDDEAGVRNLLYDVLSESYDCDRAAGGEEAIEKAANAPFHVVLSDIMMPSVSGMEVLKTLQRDAPDTAVIMVTAVQDTRRAVDAIRSGAFDYILKPFNIEEVELCVERAVRYQSLVAENKHYQERLESLVVERTSELQAANEALSSSVLEMTLCYRATVSALTTALESRDVETPGHTERVVAYALRLGKEMNLSEAELEALEHGALLHDIGMINISDDILKKPGKLDDAQRDRMRRHTEFGGQLMRRIGFFTDAIPVVEQHHEWWDGSGYPAGLQGESIDLKARIFAVADCIDGMTTARPYSTARQFSEVTDELMRCAGTQFDPGVVAAYLAVPVEEWESLRYRSSRAAAREAQA